MFSGTQTSKRSQRPNGRLAGRVGVVLALLALIAQLSAFSYHTMPTRPDMAAVVANLKMVFGDNAVLCVQADDHRGTPSQPCDDGDHCPLCQAASHAAMAPPAAPANVLAIAAGDARILGFAPDDPRPPLLRASLAQARAPPKTL